MTAGQLWLHDLSSCLAALPDEDAVLQALNAVDRLRPLGRFLYRERGHDAGHFDPKAFLDPYVAWATAAASGTADRDRTTPWPPRH